MHVCKNCGLKLSKSDVKGYPYVCYLCDENFYEIEADTVEEGHQTYVSFSYVSEYSKVVPVVVRVQGSLSLNGFQDMREMWENAWDERHETLDYPDTDEEIVKEVLDSLKVPYEIVEIKYSAEY